MVVQQLYKYINQNINNVHCMISASNRYIILDNEVFMRTRRGVLVATDPALRVPQ